MFHRQTLFVLGAGASYEAGLPVGTELAKTIQKKMDIRLGEFNNTIGSGDKDLYFHIRRSHPQEADCDRAARRIRDGLGGAQSIDDFLDIHRDNEQVNRYGKAAIVKSILEAERKSKLYCRNEKNGLEEFNFDHIADTWYVKFVSRLVRGI